MPSDEILEQQAQEWKLKGNSAFAAGNVEEAVSCYSQGLVACDRALDPVGVVKEVKTTLFSNRAMCYLKSLTSLEKCIEDCTSGLALNPSTASLRNKLLFRRSKARFLCSNLPTTSKSKQEDALQEAAKDLLQILQTDPKNKEATELLTTVRAQYKSQQAAQKISNTPLAKAVSSLKQMDEEGSGTDMKDMLHQLKIILGLLENDLNNTSMELGRMDGALALLLKLTVLEGKKVSTTEDADSLKKLSLLSIQCLSQASSHPAFSRQYLVKHQTDLVELCRGCASPESLILCMAVFVRIILHADRDKPDEDISGKTLLNYNSILETIQVALQRFVLNDKHQADKKSQTAVARAVMDLINTWTAGTDRDATIRQSLALGQSDPTMPMPKTQAEIRAFTPQQLAEHRRREAAQRDRDGAWAFERCSRLLSKSPDGEAKYGGLHLLLRVASELEDHVVRREMVVTIGRVLAVLDEEDRIKNVVRPYLQLSSKEEKEKMGVLIEEINEDNEEEEKVATVDEDERGRIMVTLDQMMQRAIITSALLLSKKEVGAWALGIGWKTSSDELRWLVDSGNVRAMCLVSEVVSAAAAVEASRHLVASLISSGVMAQLLQSDDRDIRSGAASAVAKLGLSNQETQQDEAEVMGMLQAACDLLEDDDSKDPNDKGKYTDANKFRHFSSFATSSVERAVEMMSYMISSTTVKEELAAGFAARPDSTKTALERLVQTADLPNAGESLTGFALATIFQNMAATNLQLRREGFEGREVTMEQYDEMQKLGKTEEEKEVMESKQDPDTTELSYERIRKMARANVPRAMVTLTEGASDHTLEQLVVGLNRMANVESVRGILIQQGVLSACIKIEKNEGPTETDTMKKVIQLARHCIAKMLVTTNPSLLTSAQRLGAIRPLIQLVRDNKSSDLATFEALLSLTNIAGSGDDAQNRIVSERGIGTLHFAMFSDHEMVRRAATEAMSNLIPHKAMMDHLQNEENLRLWLAFGTDYEAPHYESARAATGCLAMATQQLEIAQKLVQLDKFRSQLEMMLECGRLEIMHRVFVLVQNLVAHGGKTREKVIANGLVAFCKAYITNYQNKNTDDLEFSEQEYALLPVTVDIAKTIVRMAEDEE